MIDSTYRPPFAIFIAIALIGPLALNIFLPSMPGLQGKFAADYEIVQLTLTLYLAGFAFAQVCFGLLSERFGRRQTLLVGLALFLAGTVLCIVAATIETLIAGRFVQGVGGGSGLVVGRALIRDIYERDHAASMLAYLNMAATVALLVSPAIGGYLDTQFGWRAGFYLVLLVGTLTLFTTIFLLGETQHERSQAPAFSGMIVDIFQLLRLRAFHSYASQVAFSSATYFAFLGGAPYVVVELMGRSAREYGFYFSTLAGALMMGNFVAGRVAVRFGADHMILFGLAISLVGAMAMAFIAVIGWLEPASLFGTMAVIGFGNGLSVPSGLARVMSVAPQKAAAAGFSGFLQTAIGAGATYLIGLLLFDTAMPLTMVILAGTVLALAAFVSGAGTRRNRNQPAAPQRSR